MTEYNLAHEKGESKFKWYEGRNVDTMPQLLSEGRLPLSIAGVMQRRLELRNSPEDVRKEWMNNYFDTSDLKGQQGNEVKIVLTTYADNTISPVGETYLSLINPNERLVNGAVNLGIDNRYEALEGEGVVTMQRNELAETLNKGLRKGQAKDSNFWRVVLRHPDTVPEKFAIDGLHDEVIDYMFREGKQRYDYDSMMGVYTNPDVNHPELRAWCAGRHDLRSIALGWLSLDYSYGRFAGLAPEAQGASGKAGGAVVKSYTAEDLQAFDSVVSGLEGTLHPEVLKPIIALREKL